MTRLDFSPWSLAQARSSAERTGPPIAAGGVPDADRSGRTPRCPVERVARPDDSGPDGESQLTRRLEGLPLSYAIQARKD
ncbi:hypothetical protein IU470_10495 [Nocardia abscessus]|uniref:Uncharacterized protein n=1 Tax=Nocardia abscessus TaxID=120957 RepID=A0ABS0C575_9NOCA|nr:hypothetical protein [Nocardia abscessus]MBF6225534.1 hypothetical protein [Nocardia abscessus]